MIIFHNLIRLELLRFVIFLVLDDSVLLSSV